MDRLFKHPRAVAAAVGLITLFFAFQLPRARLDNNNFRFVPKNDPARQVSARIDDVFGSQIFIMVGLERRAGGVLDADFLNTLRAYVEKVEEIPIVGKVTSIVSTDYITGTADSIVVEPLVPEGFTGTAAELAELRDRLQSWELYERALVSEDFTATQVLVPLEIDAESAGTEKAVEAYRSVKRLAREAGFKGTRVYVAGMPVFSAVVNEAMMADLVVLIPLVVVVVLGVLFLSFRRMGGIVLPLLTVAIASVWAIGAMALFGVKLSIMSTVLPVILVAVGSAYGIHVVSHYYDETAGKSGLSRDAHAAIVRAVMRKIGRPVLLAALTTFAGFVSLCLTPVVPIAEFGAFASFGVIVSFLVSATLIPSLLLIRGPRGGGADGGGAQGLARPAADPLSGAMADGLVSAARKKRTTLLFSFLLVAFSLFGVSRLIIDNVMIEYFKGDTEIVLADQYIRRYFGGSKTLSIVVSGENRGDVLHPEVLGALDGLSSYLKRSVPEVGKTTGFTDMVKRINQVFNADESPDGLAARGADSAGSSASGESSFGFGFSDAQPAAEDAPFGFASFDPAPTSSTASAPSSPARAPAASAAKAAPDPAALPGVSADRDSPLDQLKMVALLSRALSENGGKGMSGDELVAALKKAVNYQGAAYYEIPTDPARYGKNDAEALKSLISSYLVLLSGDIGDYADDPLEPRSVRTTVQLRTVGQKDTDRAIAEMRAYAAEHFPKNVSVEIGGVALVEEALNRLVVQSQLQSVAFSLFMVFLILTIYYKSAVAGLIGLIPLSISILVNFGVMGVLGIKLNIGTAMIASIAVGIGIDYIIHYLAAYHHESLAAGDDGDFLRRTFLTSGKAILFNALSVGAGFAVLAFSQFNMLAYFGALIALAMGTSALVSLTLLPVLLSTFKPAFIRRPMPFEENESRPEVTA